MYVMLANMIYNVSDMIDIMVCDKMQIINEDNSLLFMVRTIVT